MPEWDPEVELDAERARALIGAQFSIAYGSLLGEARAAFLDAYGPVDSLAELRARVIATFLAALLGRAGAEGMAALRAEALRSLVRVVA